MKRLFKALVACFLLLAGGVTQARAAQHTGLPKAAAIIARVHWAGVAQPGDLSSGRVFREIWALPATARLRQETSAKLAAALAGRLKPKANQSATDCARLLQPLFNDLADAEVYLEITELPEDALDTTLAARLDENRIRAWQKAWTELTAGWTPQSSLGHDQLATFTTNGWFAIRWTAGARETTQPSALLSRLQRGERPAAAPKESWLAADLDLARWSQWLWNKEAKNLPRVDLTVAARKEYLRTQARLTYREPAISRIEKWEIPTDTIRDPLISFTAVQGVGNWLKQKWPLQEYGLERAPNQLYLWGLSQTAFQIQAAAPVDNASAAFKRIEEVGVPKLNRTLAEYAVGNIIRLKDRPELTWKGLPLLVPYLDPIQDHNRGYLHAGIFPVNPPTNAAPPELFQQLTGQTNLVYYDWEITQARLGQLRPLLQLGAVFLNLSAPSTNSVSSQWLDAIEPRLGNSITEVSVTSPKELQLVRTSHLGMNGLELVSFANWLEGTNFPALELDIRFRPVVRSSRQKPAGPGAK